MAEEASAQARFGLLLRYWRERAGMTQAQLAAHLRYDHSLVSRLESGRRPPQPRLAEQIDQLLNAGGELVRLSYEAYAGHESLAAHGGSVVPLPGGRQMPDPVPESMLREPTPRFGLACPLHGSEECAAITEPALSAAGLSEADGVDEVSVHALIGLLSLYTLAGQERSMPNVVAATEWRARDVAARAADRTGRQQAILLHLAASYAALAGELRADKGQYGHAMAWLCQGTQWGMAAGNVAAVLRILTQMAVIARMEDDAEMSASYATAMIALDPSRRWGIAQAQMHLARASALRGDRRSVERCAATAQQLSEHFDERDNVEAPWLCGAEGAAYMQSALSGALRDLTLRRADPAIARRAASCAESALGHLPAYMRQRQLMLSLRLADCQARSGDADAALATAAPVLLAAGNSGLALVDHELRCLRSSMGDLFSPQ